MISITILGIIPAIATIWAIIDYRQDTRHSAAYQKLIFENKNQRYGAYRIRAEYDGAVVKGMLSVMAALVLICLCTLFKGGSAAANTAEVVPDTTDYKVVVFDMAIPEDPAPEKKGSPAAVTAPKDELKWEVADKTDKPFTPVVPAGPVQEPSEPGNPGGSDSGTATSGPGAGSAEVPKTPAGPLPAYMVDVNPEFPGGMEALKRYLAQVIRYPDFEKENDIEGTVYISFIVDGNGNIQDVSELKGIKAGPNLSREAMRVIRNMPRWTPGKLRGQTVSVVYQIPVRFKLN